MGERVTAGGLAYGGRGGIISVVSNSLVIGLGEVLWDLLPAGRQLGGAPANFACHVNRLGGNARVVSAVGDDALGRELLQRLDALDVSTEAVQVSADHPTGTVSVTVDAQGQPQYVIHENVAWDFLAWTPPLHALASQADCVCVGSLAQRSHGSAETIQRFLAGTTPACLRIFDINLRQHYYSAEVIEKTLSRCQVLKLNVDEWPVLAKMFGMDATLPGGLQACVRRWNLRLLALTRGDQGSVLVTPGQTHELDAIKVQVVDTVGAGDAFTARLAMGLLRNEPLETLHEAAAKLAALVCTQQGATLGPLTQ